MKKSAEKCEEEPDDKRQVTAYLSRALLRRVDKVAHASHRTMSGQIAFFLERGLTNLSPEEKVAAGIEIANEV